MGSYPHRSLTPSLIIVTHRGDQAEPPRIINTAVTPLITTVIDKP